MAKVEIELNSEGVRELLRSSEMKAICESYANGIAQRACEGYEVSSSTGSVRVNAKVRPGTPHAYYSNLKHNTLLKVMR